MPEELKIEEIFLSREDQETLERLAPAIEMLETNIAKCEKAGIDVTAAKEDLAKAKALREGILRELVKP